MNVKTGLMRQIGLCFTDLAAVTYTYAELAQLSYRLNKPINMQAVNISQRYYTTIL